MSDKNDSKSPDVITTEVEASEQTVAAVRNEIPVGVAGTPIDRLPLQPGLTALANAGIYTKRIASTDRCIRVIDCPVKGGGVVQAHCSRACVSVGDMKLCPDHDKAAFQPNQTPVPKGRVINSASIPLSKAEQDEVARTSKAYAEAGEAGVVPAHVAARREQTSTGFQLEQAEKVADKIGAEPPHDLKIYLKLDELVRGDVLGVLKARICDALDGLPCRNVREMKQIVDIQKKVARIGKSRRRESHGGTESTAG